MLKSWIKREGTEGRRQLFEAIRAIQSRFSQVSLTQYMNGDRIPDLEIAQVISRITGIPIFQLSFRFVNRPDDNKR